MKKTYIYLAVILLSGFCLNISAQVRRPSEDLTKLQGSEKNPASEMMVGKRTGADEQGTVKASPVVPSEIEKQVLKNLKEARTSGDRETARTLQAYLDRLHGVTISTSSTAIPAPPVVHHGIVEGESPAAPLWGGDVLIPDPGVSVINSDIVSTPAGILYAAGDLQLNNNIHIYRSIDSGKTWSYILWISAGEDLRNPTVAYGANSFGEKALYVAYEVRVGNQHGVYVTHIDVDTLAAYHVSVDWGFAMAGSEQVYPRICTDNLFLLDYYVYVTYAVYGLDYYPVMFSRSTNYGVTYTTPANITGGAENSSWPTRSDIAYGASGLFVAYEKLGWYGSGWETQPWVTESNDFGSSFVSNLQLASSSSPGYHPAVAAAQDDSCIVVAYTKEFVSDTDVNYAFSTDGGTSWSTEYTLPWSFDDEKAANLCTSNSFGRFHAAYYQDTNSVRYTYSDCSTLTSWDSGTVVNDVEYATSYFGRPSVCVNPAMPANEEGCVSWTDFRGPVYGAFFDTAVIPPLSSDASVISASTGGTVTFSLDAGPANGGRNYILLGGVTGVSPGTPLPGGFVTLPLNWDAFTDLVFNMINTPVFFDFLGTLSPYGQAQAQLNSPPLSATLVGLVMDYAFCLNNLFDYASNSLDIEFVP